MIVHPEKGLIVPVGGQSRPYMNLHHSGDRGRTWQRKAVPLSDEIHPLEPTGFYHDGRLIFVTRNHQLPFRYHTRLHEPQRPSMLVSDTGWPPFAQQALTNISSHRWPDTTDIDFNSVTGSFEAVVCNRFGGAEEKETDSSEGVTVNLWSIAKKDLQAGKADTWRFEATLLKLQGGNDAAKWQIDGTHPGGAVMDHERGVQHIFVYSGPFNRPVAGIHRITRTLKTAELRAKSRR